MQKLKCPGKAEPCAFLQIWMETTVRVTHFRMGGRWEVRTGVGEWGEMKGKEEKERKRKSEPPKDKLKQ